MLSLSASLTTLSAQKVGPKYMSLLAAALLLAVLPFEVDHLLFMLVGASAYLVLYKLQTHGALRPKQKSKHDISTWRGSGSRRAPSPSMLNDCGALHVPKEKEGFADTGLLKQTATAAPVFAPVFGGAGWEADVTELLRQITPTPQCEKAVAQIASLVKRVIGPVFPNADVSSFVCGNIEGGKAFGVAVPEVDIVIHVDPANVTQRRNQGKNAGNSAILDARALQKYAMRLCTEKLVGPSVGLKFRRTAYRGDEPKATFLAPAALRFCRTSVPFDVSVNSLGPFYNAALLTECGQLEPRARELILLVRRWAKDRGICHASKNHLPPYVWTILTIYFLQVGVHDEGPLLPPVESFAVASDLMIAGGVPKERQTWVRSTSVNASAGSLFKAFFRFYANFRWREEAVAVRTAKRAAPALVPPLHILVHDDGNGSEVGPSIEDPFVSERNLATCFTPVSLMRFREELARADELCAKDASLTALLEPWSPAEFGVDGGE